MEFLPAVPSFPGILLFINVAFPLLAIIAALVLELLFPTKEDEPPAGCRKLGLPYPTNMKDQYDPKHSRGATGDGDEMSSWRVKALVVYPIKSCQPVELQEGEVIATGMKYDREFSFARYASKWPRSLNETGKQDQDGWKFITQREFPLLAKVKTEVWVPDPSAPGYGEDAEYVREGGCVVISFPFTPDISYDVQGFNNFRRIIRAKIRGRSWTAEPMISFRVPFNPTSRRQKDKKYSLEKMRIWKDSPEALNVGTEIPAPVMERFKYFIGAAGQSITLFRADSTRYREVFRCAPRKDEVGYQPVVGFTDAYPLHVLGLSSVHDVASKLPEPKRKLDAIRFRANVYVAGPPAFAEDHWRKVRIGSSTFHVSSRMARCHLPDVDPETGIREKNQPYGTMSDYRKIDVGAPMYPCLGMTMTPITPDVEVIKVGDEVEVLETGEHKYIMQ